MRARGSSADRELARIASRQHGTVTIGQALRAGLSREAVRRRVEKGTRYRAYRGVFRVGHRAPSDEAGYMAAVLAFGDRAVLSGRAAAYLYGLIKGAAPRPEITTLTCRRVKGASPTGSAASTDATSPSGAGYRSRRSRGRSWT